MAMHIQVAVSAALQELKFTLVENTSGEYGGAVTLSVSDEAVQYVKKLADDKKNLIVDSDGGVAFK